MFDVQRLAFAADEHRELHGAWPTLEGLWGDDSSLPRADMWQRPFRIVVAGDTLTVRSAGVDGTFDTCDDVASDPMRAPGVPTAAGPLQRQGR